MTTPLPAAGIALPQIPQAPAKQKKTNGKAKVAAPAPAKQKKTNGKAAKPKLPPAPANDVPVPAPTLIPIASTKDPVELHKNLLTGKITVTVNDPSQVEVVTK